MRYTSPKKQLSPAVTSVVCRNGTVRPRWSSDTRGERNLDKCNPKATSTKECTFISTFEKSTTHTMLNHANMKCSLSHAHYRTLTIARSLSHAHYRTLTISRSPSHTHYRTNLYANMWMETYIYIYIYISASDDFKTVSESRFFIWIVLNQNHDFLGCTANDFPFCSYLSHK